MKVFFLNKRKDACWWFRVLGPMSMLTQLGVECRDEEIEVARVCQNRAKGCPGYGLQEHQFFSGDRFLCRNCQLAMPEANVSEWRMRILDGIDWSDLVVFQRSTHPEHLQLMLMAKKLGKKVVYEADDNYFDVPAWNSGFQYYRAIRPSLTELIRNADLLTVTTRSLADRYREMNPRAVVLPNSLDLELIDAEIPASRYDVLDGRGRPIPCSAYEEARIGKTVVGWGGSPTHEKDLELVIDPLRKIAQRTEDTIFAFVGYVHRAVLEVIPKDRLFLFALVPVSAYFSLYKSLRFDVSLAPVVSDAFNHSKSNLKTIEAQALGAIPVASNTVTYRDTIHQGFLGNNGDSYDWFCKIRRAIYCDDREERVSANRKYVEDNFNLQKNALLWKSTYEGMLG